MKILFVGICLVFTTICHGQLLKNTWLVGGSGSFERYDEDYTSPLLNNLRKVISIDIDASIGNFVMEKFAVGLRPSFSYYKADVYENGINIGRVSGSSKFLIGPFARYYFLPNEKVVNLFADASYKLGFAYYPHLEENGSTYSFNALAGMEAYFNSSIGIELVCGYRKTKEEINEAEGFMQKRKGLYIGIGFQLHLEKL